MDSKTKDELSEIIDDYASIPAFITEYNLSTAPEFDYYVVNKMSLFLVHDTFDFEGLDGMLSKLEASIPSIKRIFVKPIIQLKEEDEVLPVEAVRLVNNATIHHIASHSELWDDYSDEGIQPLKLLTRTYRDNYSIYENILFARTVNCILSYLRKNMRELKAMMYTSDVLEFNLLERLNHLNYYLAIGKLHTGYVRDFGKYYDEARAAYKRMDALYGILSARLKRNVYKYNKNYKGDFHLHNSNILHMQKDYHRVYLLYKHFTKINMVPKEITKEDYLKFQKDYMDYVLLITLFSVMNFNFECSKDEKIDFRNPDVNFTYLGFHLHITRDEEGDILLYFRKDKDYRIVLSPSWSKKEEDSGTVRITPFETEENALCLSISDVESFRRIGKLLYKGMVYSDLIFDTCAFCGHELKRISGEGEPMVSLCSNCNAEIEERTCTVHHKKYYVTSIYGFHADFGPGDNSAKLHYRNITDYTKEGEVICPLCKMVHPD